MILMAIKTLSGHQRTHLNEANPDDFRRDTRFPQASDLDLQGITWNAHMARTIPPGATLPLADTRPFTSQTNRRIEARQAQRRQYKATQRRITKPTFTETVYNRSKIREVEWEFANRHTDFGVQDDAGRVHFVTVVPCCRDFDNSLWHALSYQVNGRGLQDSTWNGLRGGRREKAWLYNYFMCALLDPSHPRHRAYTWMQQNEKTKPGTPRDNEILASWGELSILRALATNRPHAGRPKWPANPGIFQLISDFFRMEVIVFVGTRGLPLPPVFPMPQGVRPILSSWRLPYPYYVFGKSEYGRSRGSRSGRNAAGNGQLFFVTDSNWQHFDAVRFPRFSDIDPADNFDTSQTTNEHRYGTRNFPFFTDPATGLYNGGELPDIPMPVGPALGPQGQVWCPAEDMAWRLPNTHEFVQCSKNDWDIVDAENARGNGRMPQLPTLANMANWVTPVGLPGADLAPANFEDWLVTSGCYYPGDDRDRQPVAGLLHDDIAKRFYDAKNTLHAQGHQFETGEGIQEPDELEVIAGNPHIQYVSPDQRIVRRGQ